MMMTISPSNGKTFREVLEAYFAVVRNCMYLWGSSIKGYGENFQDLDHDDRTRVFQHLRASETLSKFENDLQYRLDDLQYRLKDLLDMIDASTKPETSPETTTL